MSSIRYYDQNAQDFYNRTIQADVQDLYQKFLMHVPQRGKILDAGCGVGRDTKFFLSKGYEVVAFDGSKEMVKMASHFCGETALHMRFQEMHFSQQFDAIWANASLLHVPYENLREVMERFHKALLPSGVIFASFKYGTSMRQAGDRTFFDLDEAGITPYLTGLFTPIEIWKSADTRSTVAPSPDQSWLNCIAKRMDHQPDRESVH